MNPLCIRIHTMRHALEDPDLFGGVLAGDTWAAWRVILIASQGEELTQAERAIFTELTGREREPAEPVDELWGIVGRRGGKTRGFAVLGSYLAGCIDYSAVQAPGERLKLPIMAQTTRTARKAFGYVEGIFKGSDELRTLLVNKAAPGEPERFDITQDTIRLSTGVDIEVVPANFKTVRAETLIACLCDEVAYWHLENSANPDAEILEAVRPGLGTTGGPLCVLSSPYARKGELYKTHQREFGPKGDPGILVLRAASRTMNPSLDPKLVERAYARDPAVARAEYGAEFRKDVEAFVTLEAVQACMQDGALLERAPAAGTVYSGFADMSGGGADSMTLAIAHKDDDIALLDAVREESGGTSPDLVVERFAALLKAYGLREVRGDRYAGAWVSERFKAHGIAYLASEQSKTDIYLNFLPVLNSQRVRLLNVPKLEPQLVSLERHTSRGTGRDIIDHPQMKSAHDDVANAVAGAVVFAEIKKKPLVITDKILQRAREFAPRMGSPSWRRRQRY